MGGGGLWTGVTGRGESADGDGEVGRREQGGRRQGQNGGTWRRVATSDGEGAPQGRALVHQHVCEGRSGRYAHDAEAFAVDSLLLGSAFLKGAHLMADKSTVYARTRRAQLKRIHAPMPYFWGVTHLTFFARLAEFSGCGRLVVHVKGGRSRSRQNEHLPLEIDEMPCSHAGVTHLAVRIVQERVAYHGGSILRLITDDKGTRFLIAFGLPGQQYGDDVTRAVRAMRNASA
eukprot:6189909-Pleurochrysis_carterae.AAC.1